jgi:hypothetical protein
MKDDSRANVGEDLFGVGNAENMRRDVLSIWDADGDKKSEVMGRVDRFGWFRGGGGDGGGSSA